MMGKLGLCSCWKDAYDGQRHPGTRSAPGALAVLGSRMRQLPASARSRAPTLATSEPDAAGGPARLPRRRQHRGGQTAIPRTICGGNTPLARGWWIRTERERRRSTACGSGGSPEATPRRRPRTRCGGRGSALSSPRPPLTRTGWGAEQPRTITMHPPLQGPCAGASVGLSRMGRQQRRPGWGTCSRKRFAATACP